MLRIDGPMVLGVGALLALVLCCTHFPCYQSLLLRNMMHRHTFSRQCSRQLSFLRMTAAGGNMNNDALSVLKQATFQRDVPSEVVADKFESLEKDGLSKTGSSAKASSMRGQWELVYSSLIPNGYFPVKEIADFFGYSLTSSWGPIPLGSFEGDSEVTSEEGPAVIKFNSKKFKLGPLSLSPKPKDRSYTFLYTGPDFAVALSSSGGKTLLKRFEEDKVM